MEKKSINISMILVFAVMGIVVAGIIIAMIGSGSEYNEQISRNAIKDKLSGYNPGAISTNAYQAPTVERQYTAWNNGEDALTATNVTVDEAQRKIVVTWRGKCAFCQEVGIFNRSYPLGSLANIGIGKTVEIISWDTVFCPAKGYGGKCTKLWYLGAIYIKRIT